LKISRLLPYIMGAVIIGASTTFLIDTKPALADCNGFACTRIERRVHCKKWKGCAVQYRKCTRPLGGNTPKPETCGEWKNSL
jgi:hypothetical protein